MDDARLSNVAAVRAALAHAATHRCVWRREGGFCGRGSAACCTARHSTAQHGTAQHGTARHSTARHGTARHSTAQHSTAQHSTAQHSTAQHSTAQHSTAQHSTAQHSTAHHHTHADSLPPTGTPHRSTLRATLAARATAHTHAAGWASRCPCSHCRCASRRRHVMPPPAAAAAAAAAAVTWLQRRLSLTPAWRRGWLSQRRTSTRCCWRCSSSMRRSWRGWPGLLAARRLRCGGPSRSTRRCQTGACGGWGGWLAVVCARNTARAAHTRVHTHACMHHCSTCS
jgi:hypothetical protein